MSLLSPALHWRSGENKFLVGLAPILSDQCLEKGSHFRELRCALLVSASIFPWRTELWKHTQNHSLEDDWWWLRRVFSSWSNHWWHWLFICCQSVVRESGKEGQDSWMTLGAHHKIDSLIHCHRWMKQMSTVVCALSSCFLENQNQSLY